jgi:hypothetical protein
VKKACSNQAHGTAAVARAALFLPPTTLGRWRQFTSRRKIMAGILDERYGVSVSGATWDVGPFKLWEGQSPNVILFSPAQPTLKRNPTNHRGEVTCTTYRTQADDTYKIVGGGASMTIATGIDLQPGQLQALKDEWRQFLAGAGVNIENPIFVPLNTRKGQTSIAIPAIAGKPSPLTDKFNDAGTPGGTLSYMVDLSTEGAQEWAQAFTEGTAPTGQIVLMYEYLRYMPTCAVEITLHGKRVFEHFSAHLNASAEFFWYGGSLDIQAQFESLVADGSIEMKFIGLDDLPSGMEKIKENVIKTVTDQGLKAMLNILFQPKPDVKAAQAGNARGIFGGANLALKWQRAEQAIDIHTKLEFGGFTWLTERADIDLSVLAGLDESYVTAVNTELQFPATVTVIGDPLSAQTAVSWTVSEGQAPKSPVFGQDGGNQTYIVTSKDPNNVVIEYMAKIDYQVSSWPMITEKKRGTVKADGMGNIRIKPGEYIDSTTIYLYVEDAAAGGIKLMGEKDTSDYMVVNVTYTSPALPRPIKASTRLTLDTPVTFNMPQDPEGRPGVATFSAFGVVQGKLVRAKEQQIGSKEQSVFILVRGGEAKLQLVSEASRTSESDALAQSLLKRRDRVLVTGAAAPMPRPKVEDERPSAPAYGATDSGTSIHGAVVAVEYGLSGAALWIEHDGKRQRIPLASASLAAQLRERENVDVFLGTAGAVDKIVVELPTP